jgi:GTP-binding protein
MQWLGENDIPFVIVFTKTDKLGKKEMSEFKDNYSNMLLESWDELPEMFTTSSDTGEGRDEILGFIDRVNKS